MEDDSPNLFDSEPVPVKLLTTAADPVDSDDASAETPDGPGPSGVEISAAAVEYRTDESEDENDDRSADGQDGDPDRPADGQDGPDGDPARSKTAKDVHRGLPPGRVKLIMKMDPDVNIVAGDAVFLLTKATVI